MAKHCLSYQNYTCGSNHFYTTAKVFQSNNYAVSPYACQEYCTDGCCYLFDYNARASLTSYYAIIGWIVLTILIAVGIISFCFARKNAKECPNLNIDIPSGYIISTYVAIGVSFVTAMILLQLTNQKNVQESISWTFPPRTLAIIAIIVSCILAAFTITVSFYISLSRDYKKIQSIMRKIDNITNAATAVVALIAICLLPLIGGWDGFSGIAFLDKNPSNQFFAQNKVRYTHIIVQQTAILGIVISFLTKTLLGMLFQLIIALITIF